MEYVTNVEKIGDITIFCVGEEYKKRTYQLYMDLKTIGFFDDLNDCFPKDMLNNLHIGIYGGFRYSFDLFFVYPNVEINTRQKILEYTINNSIIDLLVKHSTGTYGYDKIHKRLYITKALEKTNKIKTVQSSIPLYLLQHLILLSANILNTKNWDMNVYTKYQGIIYGNYSKLNYSHDNV